MKRAVSRCFLLPACSFAVMTFVVDRVAAVAHGRYVQPGAFFCDPL